MAHSLIRLLQIHFILAKYRVDTLILKRNLLWPFRLLSKINPFNWRKKNALSSGIALRKCLEELSPIYVKLGQALATRRDLIPKHIADELALLQDSVEPFPHARQQIEKVLKSPIEDCFKDFDEQPLASASIAQVHTATLLTGEPVVLKVVRPKIKKQIKRDLRMMRLFAKWMCLMIPASKRLRPFDIVSEFEKTLFDELDLIKEGANASQLRRNLKNDQQIYIPKVYWKHSKKSLLVIERIHGIRISEKEKLQERGFDLKRLAKIGVELFFIQVFRDNFFHADMHAGNIFVKDAHPENPQFILVDFGIMGSLSNFDKRYLAQNFYAFIQKDYYRVAELHIASNWVPHGTRIDEFTGAVRAICEPILERPNSEVSCAQLLLRLFDIGRKFKMELLPQLLLLQKTLFAVEGLGRDLHPELNIWSTAKPYIKDWMKTELGVRGLVKTIKRNLPYWQETFPELPQLLHDVLIGINQRDLVTSK